jgi:stress response protein SCP2
MIYFEKDKPQELPTVTRLVVGASWKTSGGGQKGLFGLKSKLAKMQGTDLDLCAVALSAGAPKRMCWFDNLDAFDDGSLVLLGDDTKGRSAGDNEIIRAELDRLPGGIDTLVFIVSAFKDGVSFATVEGVTFNVYDASGQGQVKLGDYMPDIDSRHDAAVVAKVSRGLQGWTLTIINQTGNASSRDQLLALGRQYA